MSIPSIADILSIQTPAVKANHPNGYTFNGSSQDLERLKSANDNAETLLLDGIDAVAGLLLTLSIHCDHDEVTPSDTIGALALIQGMAGGLHALRNNDYILSRAQPQNALAPVKQPA